MSVTWFYYISLILVAFIQYIKQKHSYWEKLGVSGPKPLFLVGHSITRVRNRVSILIAQTEFYHKFKHVGSIIGIYFWTKPVALIADLDLIKKIMITDFEHFTDHAVYCNEKDEPMSAHLFSLPGEKWKSLRAKLTSTFTSGKMRLMFPLIVDILKNFQNVVEQTVNQNQDGFEIKDVMSRFTTDVIGTCAFGLECNSLEDPDNLFRKMGDLFFKRTFFRAVKVNLALSFPTLAKALHITILRKEVTDFFLKTVQNTVKYREKNQVRRNDFMDLLIDLKNNAKNDHEMLSVQEIAAQSFIFFVAGFETSSATMMFCLLELAINQDIQQKTREHIIDVLKKNDNILTYECLQEMDYLEKVINETLRKYPPIGVLNRIVTKDYEVPSTKILLKKGTLIMIPAYGIQMDPEIYEDPTKFDPSRFDKDKIANRHPCAFLPFGEGPRICIGLRFGVMQAKIGLVSLLTRFQFDTSNHTQFPVEFDNYSAILTPRNGVHLKVSKINQS